MESDFQQLSHHIIDHNQHQHPQKQLNSGLTRYQSAPSSYFSSFIDKDFCEEFFNRPSSPETERIFARFLSSDAGGNTQNISDQGLSSGPEIPQGRETAASSEQQRQVIPPVNNETGVIQQQQSNYSSASQNFYQSQAQQNLQSQHSGSAMEYRTINPMGMERFPQMKTTSGSNSNLIRHSSSPAGFFANINVEKMSGYGLMRGMGDFGASSSNREAAYSSSRPLPSPSIMSPIAEMGDKNMGANATDNFGFVENHQDSSSTGFPSASWDSSVMMSEKMSGVKRLRDDDRSLSGLGALENQNADAANRPTPLLSHHLSLPKTSVEISTIEKFLQFQDSVPCKIRAKRGCATHPRSIAERVRRTKISERMRKLQDLVPNMDKQTNTADMLDLAVDYIKDLQNQVKTLSDNRAKCTCACKQQQ